MVTLTPAYGRDYTSKAKAEADLRAGKDFILRDISSQYDGKPVGLSDLTGQTVILRYGKLRKTATVKI